VQLGTIDQGYTGEIGVICDNTALRAFRTGHAVKTVEGKSVISGVDRNLDEETYIIRKGERIAQLIIAPVETAHFVDVDKLEESIRGVHGFGSSGVK
jgi:dUTP pyrophosphatase